jgi:hypothetical protein
MDTHVALLMYKTGQALYLYGHSRFGNGCLELRVESGMVAVCYGLTCCFEIFAVLGCYEAQIGSCLQKVQDNRLVPSSRVEQSKKTTAVCYGYRGCSANV